MTQYPYKDQPTSRHFLVDAKVQPEIGFRIKFHVNSSVLKNFI